MTNGDRVETTPEYARFMTLPTLRGVIVDVSDRDRKVVEVEESDGNKHWINTHWLRLIDRCCCRCCCCCC
jgi:hypothetical protein